MPRLRFTLEQAEREARRLAKIHVASLSGGQGFVVRGATSDRLGRRSQSTKLPVSWCVMFTRDFGNGSVADGGELLITVDIETQQAKLSPL